MSHIKTFSHAGDWKSKREVLNNNEQNVVENINDIIEVGKFSTDSGDRLLVIFSLNNITSGYKLSSDMSSSNSFSNQPVMQLHASAHVFQFGDATNNVRITYNMAGEFRSTAIWIDRSNLSNTMMALSVANSSPVIFSGINGSSNLTTIGNDLGIGSQTFTMKSRGSINRGPVKILKWPAGSSVPSLSEIKTMLEWTWYEWTTKNHFILYPPLSVY